MHRRMSSTERCGVIYNSDILTDSTLGGCCMAWHFEVVVVDRIKIKIDVLDGYIRL